MIGGKLVLISVRKSHELSIGTKIGRAALSAVAELLVKLFLLVSHINFILSCAVSKLLRVIGQIFAFDVGTYLSLTNLFGVNP